MIEIIINFDLVNLEFLNLISSIDFIGELPNQDNNNEIIEILLKIYCILAAMYGIRQIIKKSQDPEDKKKKKKKKDNVE